MLGKTVEQLLKEISSREITEWMAYSTIEPFGEKRADLRAGTIVQAILAPWVKKGTKKPTLKDCTMSFEGPKKMSLEDIKQFFKSLAHKMRKK